jgi:hypothetical protein
LCSDLVNAIIFHLKANHAIHPPARVQNPTIDTKMATQDQVKYTNKLKDAKILVIGGSSGEYCVSHSHSISVVLKHRQALASP